MSNRTRRLSSLLAYLFLSVLVIALPVRAEFNPPAINYGGAFELLDHHGNPVSNSDFLGQYLLVYFGYTNCPDVCPTGLLTISSAIRELGNAGAQITPLFVTVDPHRDTPNKLASYVAAFHPRMVGLSGDDQQTRQIAQAYHVMYSVRQVEGRYLVGHTGNIYLMGPEGQFLDRFRHDISVAQLHRQLQQHLATH